MKLAQNKEGPQEPLLQRDNTQEKKRNLYYWIGGIVVVAVVLALVIWPQQTSEKIILKTPLNVLLYSYLPFSGKSYPYVDYIQSQFDQKYPSYQGQVKFFINDEILYDHAQLNEGLDNGSIHIAEIDSLILGEVIGNISKWTIEDQSQFYEVGIQAATINEAQYGIPRLLCSNFLFTFDKKLSEAQNYQEFQKEISGKKGLGYHINSTYGVLNYFDNYLAHYQNANQAELQEVFQSQKIEDPIVNDINSICVDKGVNQCLLKTDNDDEDWKKLQNDEFTAYVGYYETSSYFEDTRKDSLYIVPIIQWKQPMLMFTDILVRSKRLSQEEIELSNIIANFLTQKTLIRDLMQGEDLENQKPRYFIPAVKGVFDILEPGERLFENLKSIVEKYEDTMVPMISQGFKENKNPFKTELLNAMIK